MKKFLLTAAMGVLFFVGLTSMVKAPPPAFDCNGLCSAIVGVFVPTQGQCMSTCRTCTNALTKDVGAGATANCVCKFFDVLGGVNGTHGECINAVKSIINNGGGGNAAVGQ